MSLQKLHIIKVGGNIIDDPSRLSSFLRSFAAITSAKILVHGGGKLATKMAEKMGIEQKMVEGRRITDAETLKIVTMVYAGFVNKNMVAALQQFGCNAFGLCGADGNAISAHKRNHPVTDYGFVGDIDKINTSLLKNLIEQALSLVVAPVTHDQEGQLLNTNADTIAQEIAKAMSGEFDVELIYLFEKSGVLSDTNDERTVLASINPPIYRELKKNEKIYAGMIPKLDNAFAALDCGVKKVVIGSADELNLLIEGRAGTTITND